MLLSNANPFNNDIKNDDEPPNPEPLDANPKDDISSKSLILFSSSAVLISGWAISDIFEYSSLMSNLKSLF